MTQIERRSKTGLSAYIWVICGSLSSGPQTIFDVKSGVEYVPDMRTIQVVIGEDLLRSADRVARRLEVNRSALIRDALRGHLQRLRTADLERREREAYERTPDDPAEFSAWDGVAVWPEK
jgi:Arc/MetJ-type ribon-helix-helix transcriptional regulator